MLDFSIYTEKNEVVLTELGNKLLDARISTADRKLFISKSAELGTFKFVIKNSREAKDHRLPRTWCRKELVMHCRRRDVEAMFKTSSRGEKIREAVVIRRVRRIRFIRSAHEVPRGTDHRCRKFHCADTLR